ncbi:MAG: right-handed parallel beta-helix repeat-containing protein [Isosphaeraceae bacterium]
MRTGFRILVVCGLFVVSSRMILAVLPTAGAADDPRARRGGRTSPRKAGGQDGQAVGAVPIRWLGQDRQDFTGVGPSVGPDGLQDAHIHLTGLDDKRTIKAIRIEGLGGRWEYGLNPRALDNAEFVKDARDPHQGDLFFQPTRDLAGQRLKVGVLYADESLQTFTVTAGKVDPKLRVPLAPLPKVEELKLTAKWLGQDGSNRSRPGDVHVVLSGLPASARLKSIGLTDDILGSWDSRLNDGRAVDNQAYDRPLEVRFRSDRRTADLYFLPYRQGGGETFSVSLTAADGRVWHGSFPGGPCDLARLDPAPDSSHADARPGDDLQALVDRNGSVTLAPGTYRLARPLVLTRPVTLGGPRTARLVFTQAPQDAPWTTAIKLRAGNTTIRGLTVRFEGRIRWNPNVSYGPAVIGMTDSLDPGYGRDQAHVVFEDLDLESPAADDPSKWVDAIPLFRLIGAGSGMIARNRLRGGPIDLFRGPWQIVDNEFTGTPPGTFSQSFVVARLCHDLVIRGNRLSALAPHGKTWRFLVLVGYSQNDQIEDNTVEGVGSRDDDTIPFNNTPEVILTESYTLSYEGRVLTSSADGRVLRIGRAQGPAVSDRHLVAVLNGPAAGEWRRIVHVLDPATILIDRPLPQGSDAISIAEGFVNEVFQNNRIDLRGGRLSNSFTLAGNHFGTRIVGNHLLGNGHAWRLSAYPTEAPSIWGWSHAPYMGGVVEKNILEDTIEGGLMGVLHSEHTKTNRGRTYMSLQLRDNVVRWTPGFLAQRARAGEKPPIGLILGFSPSIDPQEFLVTASGNTLDAPTSYRQANALVVHAASLNSQRILERGFRLPPAAGASGDRSSEVRSGKKRVVR